MKKVIATIIKEYILLKRDVAGMMLLMLMPAVLIIVMALIQDAPFKDYQELKFSLLLVNDDHGSMAKEIITGLKQSKNFQVIDSMDGMPLSYPQLKELLQKGKYKIGIVIPSGVTGEMANSANFIANTLSKRLGIDAVLPARPARDVSVKMYFDPVMKPTFRSSISFALEKFITAASSHILLERISKIAKATNSSVSDTVDIKSYLGGINIREEPLNDKGKDKQYINSVQHNVPAWAIFGMFFIVIPISGHMIREREEGSALRLALIPRIQQFVSFGRILFYTIICSIQFVLMCCIGIWFMPTIGLPSLYLGPHPFALIPVIICIGFAATAYGYLVGAFFKTTNQALPFGSISIVILAAIGGIWVPVELLSTAMQHAALLSPLHWSLDAVDQVILRNGDTTSVLSKLFVLVAFGVIAWLAGIFINNSRYQSIQ